MRLIRSGQLLDPEGGAANVTLGLLVGPGIRGCGDLGCRLSISAPDESDLNLGIVVYRSRGAVSLH